MVSLIICSRTGTLDQELADNIKLTIGVPYEIIVINNKENNYSIFSAYNKGAEQSSYDFLCFMHDDILYDTLNWGSIIIKVLENRSIGLLGIAGATIKTKSNSPWWVSNLYDAKKYLRYNLKQKKNGKWIHEYNNPEKVDLSEVVVLDGVWLCCRKEVWDQIRFDDITFKGFHFYDLDFSLEVAANGYKNYVTNNILIYHTSAGSLDKSWLNSAEQFHKKWSNQLPKSIDELDRKDLSELEYQAIYNNLWLAIQNKHGSIFSKLKLWSKALVYKSPSTLHIKLLYSIFKIY